MIFILRLLIITNVRR